MAEETKEPTEQKAAEPHGDTTDWKAEARKWESRAKENSAAADELQKLKEAQMTEAEKAEKRAKEAEEELAQLRAAAAHEKDAREVAEANDLPASLIKGANREEMESFASELKKYLAGQQTTSVVRSDTKKPASEGALKPRDQFAELANQLLN